MKKAFISILAVLMAVVLVSCSNQGKTVDTTGVNETTETTVKTEETTITEATESTEETTVVTTESTTETTETTKAAEEEIQGECKGVWRAEKVTVSPEGSPKDISYDVSEELISIFLDDNGIYIGSTDSIKQQYSRYGDCTFNEDKSGKTVTISMFSLSTGKSLKVTYYYRMYKDMWGTIKLELVMDSIKGDATVFGFNSFMNEQHTIILSEWGFAKADSEHDPMLFRSYDTKWEAVMGPRSERLEFTYGDNFVVYINNQISGTWKTTTRGDENFLIITLKDGTILEGTYSVENRNLGITWEEDEEMTLYRVMELLY